MGWLHSLYNTWLLLFSALLLIVLCLLCYDVHDVKDTIFRAYDGLRLVTTFRGRDRFFWINLMMVRDVILFDALHPYLSQNAHVFEVSLSKIQSTLNQSIESNGREAMSCTASMLASSYGLALLMPC